MRTMVAVVTLAVAGALASVPAQAASIRLEDVFTLPADGTDFAPPPGAGELTVNTNQLSGFFSDLFYDRANGLYYGIPDRGPGGGSLDYATRVQKFKLDVNRDNGQIDGFQLLDTILFKTADGTQNFNGLNPGALNGSPDTLGLSFDPEGFAVHPNTGSFYVADEYGPSVYEFNPDGTFVRAFTQPDNILPKNAGVLDFVDADPETGRQGNRGYEGITLSPDGTKAFAVIQDPLQNEGDPTGRRSQNVRIVEFDVASGTSTAQYIYELESLVDVNARIPGTASDFGANAQGRNIGVSAILALSDHEFLILERDNRGIGVEDTLAPVGSKRIFKIDITGASDAAGIDLTLTNVLPDGFDPVSKTLFLDIAKLLTEAGQPIAEKMEGIAFGPKLKNGRISFIVGTDNDFSVTQIGGPTQFNVCRSPSGSLQTVEIDAACPDGTSLIPTFIMAFSVPEPGMIGMVLPGAFIAFAAARRRLARA